MADGVERELKLIPVDPTLLPRLREIDRLGVFSVAGRRHETQRNSFFDTPGGALGRARLAFRRRTVAGRRLAAWTLKGEGEQWRGIAVRPEVEVYLEAETAPALVIGVLGQAARERGNVLLADQLAEALAGLPPPLPKPFLELDADRRLLELTAPAQGWEVELALDRVRLVDHPAFEEQEIEVELHRGSDEALEAARAAILALGQARPAAASKLQRALAHLRSHAPGDRCR